MKKAETAAVVGATVGFGAPLTVAWVSGIKFGTDWAGVFLAASWVLMIFLGLAAYAFALDELK